MTCDRCGTQHNPTHCQGHSSRTGRQCGKRPVKGGDKCATHGLAKGTKGRAAADAKVLTSQLVADVAAVLAHEGVTGITDPVGEMALLAREVRVFLTSLGKRVNALGDVRYRVGQGEQLRAELALFERAQDRLLRVLDALAKLDLEGKRQVAADRYAGELVTLLTAVFTDLGLSEQQQARVGLVVAHHLGQVVAGQLEAGGVRHE